MYSDTRVHHYNVQSSFTALNVLCALPVCPSLPFTLWQLLVFVWSPQFCFLQYVAELESCSVQPFRIVPIHSGV